MGAVIRYVTKNGTLAYWFSFVLIDVTVLLLFVDSSIFEGLLPGIMEKLSLFERFTAFVNGVFDMTAIVYYCTVIAFFLFLSVQSMEKRRYNCEKEAVVKPGHRASPFRAEPIPWL